MCPEPIKENVYKSNVMNAITISEFNAHISYFWQYDLKPMFNDKVTPQQRNLYLTGNVVVHTP